jgi:uncharacterized protein (TIGR02266 family)
MYLEYIYPEVGMSDNSESRNSEESNRMQRLQVSAKVMVEHENGVEIGFSENISEGGVFFSTRTPLAIGTKVQVAIETGGPEGEIKVEGDVRWHHFVGDDFVGYGIKFSDLGDKEERDIGDLIEKLRNGPQVFE